MKDYDLSTSFINETPYNKGKKEVVIDLISTKEFL
jgi:hypothetical protein